MKKKQFHYAVGFRWDETDPDSAVGFYTYMNEIQRGKLKDAVKFKEYCEKQDTQGRTYRIYQVVELPEIKK